MNQTGHKIETTEDENGYRQFVVNCVGIDDQRKYFSISPFGIDFNPPETLRVVTSESRNKDESLNIGVLNKIKIDNLNLGESAIFSTDDVGEAIVSQIVLRNTGDIEINKDFEENANILIKADGTMEFNGDADFLAGYTALQEGFEELKADYNAHIHQIPPGEVIISVSGGSGAPAVGVPNPAPIDLTETDTESSASVDDCKKENLKSE